MTDAPERPFRSEPDYYADRAGGLLASARDGTAGARAAFERWGEPLTERGARRVVARRHGFASWKELRRHVGSLDGADPFVAAYRAIEAHDVDGLRAQIDRDPAIVAARGTNGNDLLGLASATCDERLVGVLLERGADPARANVHGWTPLHAAASAGLPLLTRMLLDAGAPADASARGDGGTPLIVALFWGKRETAELVASERGIAPRNLRAAAGLGALDLLDELVAPDGTLAPEAGARRAFYRPHGGFPAWEPADDPQQALDEALAWAARNDRVDALEPLVARGASVGADVYRGTALIWAAACDRPASIERLVALGADPNQRATFGGPTHGEQVTAIHLAAQDGHRASVEALLALGADPTLRDALYDGDAAGWAAHGGHDELAARLTARGGF